MSSSLKQTQPSLIAREYEGIPTPRRYWAILALSVGTALAVIDGSIVTVALPTLARDLHVQPSSAVSVVSLYQLVLVMMILPFSALGSRIGLRRLYQYGQWMFLASSVLCFFARSLPFLLVVRAMQALGAAASLSVSSALVRSIYPSRYLGRGLSLNSLTVSSANALAPTLGGAILLVAPWPWLFAAGVPLAILSLWLGRTSLPNVKPVKEPYDVLGALLCALTFGLVIAGLESFVHGDSPVISAAIVTAGVIIGVVFVRRELDEAAPILPVDLLQRPVLALSFFGAFCAFIGGMTLVTSLPFRLQQQFGFSPAQVGAVITPWPIGIMITAPLAGYLSDRFPAGVMGGIGMAISTAGMLLLAFLPDNPTQFDIAWRMAMCGAGYGIFNAPNVRLIVGASPQHRAASAGGMISTTRLTGQTLGATLLAALLAMGLGNDSTPALVGAGLTLIAGICSVTRLNRALDRAH